MKKITTSTVLLLILFSFSNLNAQVGIATASPTSTLDVNGSFAVKIASIGTTCTLADDVCKIILTNDSSNIIIRLPFANTCKGRLLSFTRNENSTGTVTLDATESGTIQNLDGTLSSTVTIPEHSATGDGVNVKFWSDGTTWYR